MPRLLVFQSPPNAEATNHVSGFLGSMTTSTTRPVTRPGPMLRNCMFSNAAAVRRSDPFVPCRAEAYALATRTARATTNTALFMGLSEETRWQAHSPTGYGRRQYCGARLEGLGGCEA